MNYININLENPHEISKLPVEDVIEYLNGIKYFIDNDKLKIIIKDTYILSYQLNKENIYFLMNIIKSWNTILESKITSKNTKNYFSKEELIKGILVMVVTGAYYLNSDINLLDLNLNTDLYPLLISIIGMLTSYKVSFDGMNKKIINHVKESKYLIDSYKFLEALEDKLETYYDLLNNNEEQTNPEGYQKSRNC